MVAAPAKQIKVMLVDDQAMVRAGLRHIVGERPSLRVVAEAQNGAKAIAAAARAQPDVILLDVNLRGESGLDLITPLLAEAPDASVLVLTGSTDTETYLSAMRRGAMGLILKDEEPAILHKAVEKVHQGEAWFDRSLFGKLQSERARPAPRKSAETVKINSLSDRQREVIELIGEGLRNKVIGDRLGISEGTVRRHLNDIFNKLDMGDRFELMIYAYRHGLAHLPQ